MLQIKIPKNSPFSDETSDNGDVFSIKMCDNKYRDVFVFYTITPVLWWCHWPMAHCIPIYLYLVLQLSQSIKTIYTKTKLTALHLANWKIIDLLNTCHSQSLYKEIGAVVIKFASIGWFQLAFCCNFSFILTLTSSYHGN